jgi:hypothetical protein
MRHPRTPAIALLCLAAVLAAGGNGSAGRAQYVGGTITSLPGKVDGTMELTDQEIFQFRTRKSMVRMPYKKITTLEYGQKVSRRYVSAILISPVLLLAKKRRHFLTLGYTDEQGRPQAMVFEVAKGDVRAILVGLEAKTGLRVEYQDDEARKAGRG